MADKHITIKANRQRRHARGRAKIIGTDERPRVAVFKSNTHVYVQAIDDATGRTLAAVNDAKVKKGTKTEKALESGRMLAGLLKTKKVTSAVFDKGGFKYHGRVKAVADGLREGGIKV